MAIIGERIKELRKKQKLTQKEFSSRVCIKQSYLSDIENGNGVPSDMLIKLISLEFSVPINWLNGLTDELPKLHPIFEAKFERTSVTRKATVNRLNDLLDAVGSSEVDNMFATIITSLCSATKLLSGDITPREILALRSLSRYIYGATSTTDTFLRTTSLEKLEELTPKLQEHLLKDVDILINEIYALCKNSIDIDTLNSNLNIKPLEPTTYTKTTKTIKLTKKQAKRINRLLQNDIIHDSFTIDKDTYENKFPKEHITDVTP